MATMVDRKGPIQGPTKKPKSTAMEVIAEEMIDGIFCHYEPPDDHSRTKSILRKPKSRRVPRDGSSAVPARRRIRWSDEPKPTQGSTSENPFEMRCLGSNCVDAAVEAGMVRDNYFSQWDYDLRETFSEDSNGGIKPRESRAHHHVIFDDYGNPVPTKPGVRVAPPPPRPPPKRKEMFIPELCGVRIGYEDDEYDDDDDSSRRNKTKNYYQRPNHTKYRPSYEYREEDENSLVTEEMTSEMRRQHDLQQQDQRQGPPPPPPPVKLVAGAPLQSLPPQELPPPPPPPPPPPRTVSRAQDQTMSIIDRQSHVQGAARTMQDNNNRDLIQEYRGNMSSANEDWGSQDSNRAIGHPGAPVTSTALVAVSNKNYSAMNLCGNNEVDCKNDWDESLPVIPCLSPKKAKAIERPKETEHPKLDAPDSRDSQEENKPEKAMRYTSVEHEESEAGTELAWHSPQDKAAKRRSFFKRGRNRDKRQSLPGRVEVLDDEAGSQVSKTSQRSFLNFRNRSKSPTRKRMFGRNRSSDVNSELGEETASQILNDLEKQSYIGAYRDSMDANETISSLHPAHPLKQSGDRRMSKDDMMERQSFITAHRESMDSGESTVQTITERLRRIRAQKAMKRREMGGGPVDLDDDFDDERFERQSMITAHRESFEPPSERKALVKVRRIRSKSPETRNKESSDPIISEFPNVANVANIEPDIPDHLKHLKTPNGDTQEEERELTWEEKTKQAWERIRSGLGLSTEEANQETKNDGVVTHTTAKELNQEDSGEKEVLAPTAEDKPGEGTSIKVTEKADAKDETDSNETLVEEPPSALEALANLFSSTSVSSIDSKPTTPLKSILKSPSSEKRVTFGEDQERIFHKDHDENEPEDVPPAKRTSLLGKLVKKATPSPKKKPVPIVLPPRSPLQQSPIPQQRSQSPVQQRSPSPMHYMYPPYPQYAMMPAQSPMNGYPMVPPGVSSDSSMQQAPPPQYYNPMQQQMPGGPVASSDSSQNSQQQQQQQQNLPLPAQQQQQQFQPPMPMPAYMAAPYFYGYPPNYGGGYMYPPPGMIPVGSFPEEQKKKKKRVFRGRKLLGVLGKGGGRNSVGGSMSSSMSMDDGYGYADPDYDESVYSVAETQT